MRGLHGKVKVWYMTEEERLAFIEKHPIVPVEKPKGAAFSNIHSYGERAKKSRENGTRSTKESWKQKKTHLAE